jgi:hypothetical protein
MQEEIEDQSPYCPHCEACGEEGCCSALVCKQHPDGDYCKSYLTDLRFTYFLHREFMKQTKLTPEQEKIYDELWHNSYDIFYRKQIKQQNTF